MNPAQTQESYETLVARHSARVDEALLGIVQGEPPIPNLHEGLIYSLGLDIQDRSARGKRIRPVLCLMTAEALGASAGAAMPFACAIELMHNFALVHDDIEDGDEVRRNRPCTYRRYGVAHGVNIGDYLLCKVLSALLAEGGAPAETQLKLLRLMSRTLDHTHAGQALDINARHSRDFTRAAYDRLVLEKTGHYLAAPMIGGAIVAGREDLTPALARFGEFIGPMFQITDDLLDLTEGKGRGGAIGNDIREGKRSFLAADAAAKASAADCARLYDILDKPRAQTSDDDIARVIELLERHGSIEAARRECERLLEAGLRELETLPALLAELLRTFATQLAQRKN